jgi:sulfatase modifying factor 1
MPWATLVVIGITQCAEIVGLTGDYELSKPALGGAAGSQGGDAGEGGAGNGNAGAGGDLAGASGDSSGGESTSGGGTSGGTTPEGGSGGAAGDGGSGGSGGSGESGGSGGSETVPPSCSDLPPTCGPNGDSDCCEASLIFGDSFDRSNDELYPATVSDFRLDLYEVTVGRFRKFVGATGGTYRPAPGSGKNPNNPDDPGWASEFSDELPVSRDALTGSDVGVTCEEPLATWTERPGPNESRPINCVTWYVAFAFCIWDGGRLPTEAEWNFAAAGGQQQRHFPWSSPPESTALTPMQASYFDVGTMTCLGDGVPGCAVTDFVVVGSKPEGRGRFRNSDLAGNVYEWMIDAFGPYAPECDDCASFTGSGRVGRGGSYVNFGGLLTTFARTEFPATYRSSAFGIRCARPD